MGKGHELGVIPLSRNCFQVGLDSLQVPDQARRVTIDLVEEIFKAATSTETSVVGCALLATTTVGRLCHDTHHLSGR